ncbi:MAG TPA: response regulator transcription factor [Flavilitoribacter sp.]|nr:response regulator transcription factor [Flavilitoribacter sp.]
MSFESLLILVVEDDPVIAEDIMTCLFDLGYRRILRARSAEMALELLESNLPDLVLLDIHLGGGASGTDLGRHINAEFRIPFVYLTSFSDSSTLQSVKETLPAGFVLKPFNEDRLRAAIDIALHTYYAVIREHWERPEDLNAHLPEPLTNRELDTLRLLCGGKSNQELADALFVSVNTIKTHLKNLYLKLAVNNRAEAIVLVQRFLKNR